MFQLEHLENIWPIWHRAVCLWEAEAGGLGAWGQHGVYFEISSQNKKQLWLLLPSFHLCNVFTNSKLYNRHKSCVGDRQNGSEGRSDCLSSLETWVQFPGLETRTKIRDRDCEARHGPDSFMTMRGSIARASLQSWKLSKLARKRKLWETNKKIDHTHSTIHDSTICTTSIPTENMNPGYWFLPLLWTNTAFAQHCGMGTHTNMHRIECTWTESSKKMPKDG